MEVISAIDKCVKKTSREGTGEKEDRSIATRQGGKLRNKSC